MQSHFKKTSISLFFGFLLPAMALTTTFLLLPIAFIHAQAPAGTFYDPNSNQSTSNTTLFPESNSTDATKAPYTLLAPLPCIGTNMSGCSSSASGSTFQSIDLSDYISYAYKLMLALAVVLAVIMITVGGFEYMLSGAVDTKTNAIKRIQDAVLGLLLALCSYLILYTIDPNLVSPNNLTIPPITYTAAQTATSNSNSNQTPITQQGLEQQAANGAQNAALNPNTGSQNAIPGNATSPLPTNNGTTPTPASSPYRVNQTP